MCCHCVKREDQGGEDGGGARICPSRLAVFFFFHFLDNCSHLIGRLTTIIDGVYESSQFSKLRSIFSLKSLVIAS